MAGMSSSGGEHQQPSSSPRLQGARGVKGISSPINPIGGSTMSRWIRNAGLVLMPALLLSMALLGCSGDKKGGDKKGDEKKGDGETPAGAMKKVSVGKGTIAG